MVERIFGTLTSPPDPEYRPRTATEVTMAESSHYQIANRYWVNDADFMEMAINYERAYHDFARSFDIYPQPGERHLWGTATDIKLKKEHHASTQRPKNR